MAYQERFYRKFSCPDFSQEVCYKESDLYVWTDKKIESGLVRNILKKYYTAIEEYVKKNPLFSGSLKPLPQDESAPEIVQAMLASCLHTGVGPFASVAGAVAQFVGKELLPYADQVMIENGGDIFLAIACEKIIGVYLGERFKAPWLNLKIKSRPTSFGIASSSSTIGPSLNFGKADLVTVIARDAVLADGFATALSNPIKSAADVQSVMDIAQKNPAITGLLIAVEGNLYLWGELQVA